MTYNSVVVRTEPARYHQNKSNEFMELVGLLCMFFTISHVNKFVCVTKHQKHGNLFSSTKKHGLQIEEQVEICIQYSWAQTEIS